MAGSTVMIDVDDLLILLRDWEGRWDEDGLADAVERIEAAITGATGLQPDDWRFPPKGVKRGGRYVE